MNATTEWALIEGVALAILGAVVLAACVLRLRRAEARRSAESEASHERLRAVIEAIPDALFRMDAEGRFLDFKPARDFQPVLPQDAFIAKRVSELPLPAQMVLSWEQALAHVQAEGGYRSIEYDIEYPDGTRQFEARIVQATSDEYLAIVREISARKQAEADRAAYQEQLERTVSRRTADLVEVNIRLQESNRAKSAFLANMSHELRTPLNSVIGFTDIMLKGLAGEINEEQARQLTMVKQAGGQLLSLVDDVLDHTRIESGRVSPLPTEFQVATLLRECIAQIRPDAECKGLHIKLDAKDAQMHSDRRLLEQVLLNLLSNAVKFTKEGSITLRNHRDGGGNIVFEVCDTGIGIDPAIEGQVFRAFEQGSSHLASKPTGFGLGLTICHQLTCLLGGTIEMESQPGHGTTARVICPQHLRPPHATSADDGPLLPN